MVGVIIIASLIGLFIYIALPSSIHKKWKNKNYTRQRFVDPDSKRRRAAMMVNERMDLIYIIKRSAALLNRRNIYPVVIVLSILFLMPSCGRRHHHVSGGRRNEITYNNDQQEGRARQNSRGGGCSRNKDRNRSNISASNVGYQPVYFMQSIEVDQNISFQEALYTMDPSAKDFEQKYDVGGTKLIAEMSADAGGLYCSRNPNADININILSLDQLKIHLDYSKASLYHQIINQQIIINHSSVGFLNGPTLAEILENFINSLLTGRLVVHLTISNITNKSILCEIKQGQMLEAVNENVQNLVVAENQRFSIAAHQQTTLDIHVYCAARHRGDPSNSQVRFTPYLLNAASAVYESQSSVWSYIENGY